ncbi:MAG: SRPBCC family protein [Nitrososphaerales archaeon]
MTSTSQLGNVIVEGEYATLRFERRLPHPPEAVWEAITEPGQLAQWYMTKAQIDGRVGGSIDFIAGISQLHVTGKILVWDPPHVLEHEWNVEPRRELPKGERTVIRWELVREGNGETLLKLTHRNLTRQTSMGFAPGTHAFLDRLEAHLNKAHLPDWIKRVEEMRSSYPSWRS